MIRFSEMESLGLRVAAMTERRDGDCRLSGPDSPREICCAALGIAPEHLVCGQQVHGLRIAVAGETERGRGALQPDAALPATDGILTALPGLPLAVFIADCVPVFLFAPDEGVAGLVHAGRQGTRENIVGSAMAVMGEHFGVSPRAVHALIGPSAGPLRYEVSEALAADWAEAGWSGEGRLLNLWETNRLQLRSAGVPAGQIYQAGLCTIEDGRFFSYRRGDQQARNMALVML